MRISDWSSDVCSSDLLLAQPLHRRDGGPAHAGFRDGLSRARRRPNKEMDMVSRATIESRLRQLNEAENSRPHATVEAGSAGIDKVMAPDVHGWRGGHPRSEERRVGNECVRTCWSRVSAYTETKKAH